LHRRSKAVGKNPLVTDSDLLITRNMNYLINAKSEGNLRFTVTHAAKGEHVSTDAPAGHGGEGLTFAPTDLVDAALATCTGATIVAKANLLGLEATGMTIGVNHVMVDAPRRIGSFDVEITLPCIADDRQKKSLIAAAKACPVRNTLRPDMQIKMTFRWNDGKTDIVEK
jgi:putative redox protein